MNEEEFFNRIINKIAKDYGYDVASTLELMFFKKEKQLKAYENMRKEAIKLIDYYGITPEQNDNVILRHILKDLLNILNKVGGSDEQ